jgi:hypothetical protein
MSRLRANVRRASIANRGPVLATLTLLSIALLGLSAAPLRAQRTPPPQGPLGETKPVDLSGTWILPEDGVDVLESTFCQDTELLHGFQRFYEAFPVGIGRADVEISQSGTKLVARELSAGFDWNEKSLGPPTTFYGVRVPITVYVTVTAFEGEIRGDKVDLHPVGVVDFFRAPWSVRNPDEPFLQFYTALLRNLHSLAKNQPMRAPGKNEDYYRLEGRLCPNGQRISGLNWVRVPGGLTEKWRAADFDALFGKPKAQRARAAQNP